MFFAPPQNKRVVAHTFATAGLIMLLVTSVLTLVNPSGADALENRGQRTETNAEQGVPDAAPPAPASHHDRFGRGNWLDRLERLFAIQIAIISPQPQPEPQPEPLPPVPVPVPEPQPEPLPPVPVPVPDPDPCYPLALAPIEEIARSLCDPCPAPPDGVSLPCFIGCDGLANVEPCDDICEQDPCCPQVTRPTRPFECGDPCSAPNPDPDECVFNCVRAPCCPPWEVPAPGDECFEPCSPDRLLRGGACCPAGTIRGPADGCVAPPAPCKVGMFLWEDGDCYPVPPEPCPIRQITEGGCCPPGTVPGPADGCLPIPPCAEGLVSAPDGRCGPPCLDNQLMAPDGICHPVPCRNDLVMAPNGECVPVPCPPGQRTLGACCPPGTTPGPADGCIPVPPHPCKPGYIATADGDCVSPCAADMLMGPDGTCFPLPCPAGQQSFGRCCPPGTVPGPADGCITPIDCKHRECPPDSCDSGVLSDHGLCLPIGIPPCVNPPFGCFEPCEGGPALCVDPGPACTTDAFAPGLCVDPPTPVTAVCVDPPIGCFQPCNGGPTVCKDPPKKIAVAPPADVLPAIEVQVFSADG